MRWALGVVLLMGCDAVFLPDEHAACAGQSGPNNTGLFRMCVETDPVAERSLLSQISTNDDCDLLVMDDREELCVITARKISVGAGVRAVGMRPLVLFSTGTIVIGGAISVTSRRNEPPAAGANAVMCGTVAAPPLPDAQTDGGGGGAGGTFEQEGGIGGTGAGMTLGSRPRTPVSLGTIRGGCSGGSGGVGGAMAALAGAPGAGGGAMYLVAAEAITIAGTLEASGAGGSGSSGIGNGGGPGGAGGGSGGLIALDAPLVTLEAGARLVANGGGGGGGGGSFMNSNGGNGTVAELSDPFPFMTAGGIGGGGGGQGGAGGDSAMAPLTGGAGANGGGGGGGGGAVGVIRIFSKKIVDNDAQVSPPY